MAHLSKKIPKLSSSWLRRCHFAAALQPHYSQNVSDAKSIRVREFNSFSFEDILSDENKEKVQKRLTQVEPARTEKHVTLARDPATAAVLVPLCTVNKEPSLLLTLRSRKLAKHRGQVSFPGGNSDDSDPNAEFTALRETQEELGIKHSAIDIWGRMHALPSSLGEGKMVYPILASIGEVDVSKIKLNDQEVEEVFTVSIQNLCNHDNIRTTRFRGKHSITIPVYTGGSHRIWGLTAVIIHMLLNIVAPDMYTFKWRHQHDQT